MATHSGILAWRIPMDREVPGGLQFTGSQRVRYNSGTKHSTEHARPLLLKSKEGK